MWPNVSSMDHQPEELLGACKKVLDIVTTKGFETLLAEQAAAWEAKWNESDIIIEGDVAAQQGIRFNIFQLWQTYTGRDDRLNIAPQRLYRRKIRRFHLLGYRGLLRTVLPGDSAAKSNQKLAALSLQTIAKSD